MVAGIAFDQARQKLCKALGITHLQRKSLYKISYYDIILYNRSNYQSQKEANHENEYYNNYGIYNAGSSM